MRRPSPAPAVRHVAAGDRTDLNLLMPGRVDVACALTLFVVSGAVAFWTEGQFHQSGLRAAFYQEEFAPAVMLACGQGLTNVDWPNDPAMKAFLQQQRPALTCREL